MGATAQLATALPDIRAKAEESVDNIPIQANRLYYITSSRYEIRLDTAGKNMNYCAVLGL